MKKLLVILVVMLSWSSVSFAKNIAYVCDFVPDINNPGKNLKVVYEIKNNKFFEDGEYYETTYIKVSRQNIEIGYKFESSLDKEIYIVTHKVNLNSGIGVEMTKKPGGSTHTSHLKCDQISGGADKSGQSKRADKADQDEDEKDKKIKELENRIKVLESRGQIKSNEAQNIRDCLDTPDIDMVAMCLGID